MNGYTTPRELISKQKWFTNSFPNIKGAEDGVFQENQLHFTFYFISLAIETISS